VESPTYQGLRSPRKARLAFAAVPGRSLRRLHVQEHKIFQRDEDNLYCEVADYHFPLATLGGEVPVPTLEGKSPLEIPGGHTKRADVKLRGKRRRPCQRALSTAILLVRVMVESPDASQCRSSARSCRISPELCGERKTAAPKKLFSSARIKEFFKVNKDRGLRGWKRIRFPNLGKRTQVAPEFFAESFSVFVVF